MMGMCVGMASGAIFGTVGSIGAESKLGDGSPKYSKRRQAHGRRQLAPEAQESRGRASQNGLAPPSPPPGKPGAPQKSEMSEP